MRRYFQNLTLLPVTGKSRVDDKTSELLTFATPFGRFKFKRMPYGLHSASEIFQQAVTEIIEGVEKTVNLQGDIIIWGSNQEQHDETLFEVLDRIRPSRIKLNKSKCVFSLTELTFLGHIVSKDGIKIDPKKCSAIVDLPMPTNKMEIQLFLGMMNYIGKFIPNLSQVTQPANSP